jgi:hypothetical protein
MGNTRYVLRSLSLRRQQYPYIEGIRARAFLWAIVVRAALR